MRKPGLVVAKTFAEVTPAPILHLHRHADGYIAFATERDGEDWRPLVSIRAGELETWFPLFREQLLKDSFVGINADFRLRSYGDHGAAYGYPLHRTNRLRYVNACYADLDCYKLGLDVGTVIGRVINLQDSGQLPHASMIVRSGRGLWLLWLIHDPKTPDQSAGAFPDKLDLYARIQQAIIERLLHLGADPAARDATRHIRVPGSLHTAAESTVEWWVQGRSETGYTYTLQELAERLRVVGTIRHGREVVAHNPAKRRGWVALNARRLREFNTLRAMRGGFSEGHRNNAAKIYAWLLYCNGLSYDVPGLTGQFGRECRPPLSKAEIKDAWKYAKQKLRRMKDQTVSDWLNITTAEASLLEKLPPASGFRAANDDLAPPIPRERQQRAIQERRGALQAIIAGIGHVPPVREMARLLGERGFSGNHQTTFTDYKALGLEWDRTRKATRMQEARQLLIQPAESVCEFSTPHIHNG
jgi:hypothetical protein